MSVISLPPPKMPPYLKKILDGGRWSDLASSLKADTGLKLSLVFNEKPLFCHILERWGELESSSLDVTPMEGELKKVLLSETPEFMDESTSVCWASFYGQWSLALDLLDLGFPIDNKSWSIWEAIISGYMERLPLEKKEIRQLSGNIFPLDVATKSMTLSANELWGLRMVMQKAKTLKPDFLKDLQHPESPLLWSLLVHQHHVFEAFFDLGINPNILIELHKENESLGYHQDVSLMQAAIESGNTTAIEILLDCGFIADFSLHGGHSLIDCAILTKQRDCLNVLLKDLPKISLGAMLPFAMIYAVAENDIAVVRILMEHGCSLYTKTASGYTLMHQAAMTGTQEMVNFLLDNGLKWDEIAENGVSPFDLMKSHNPDLSKKIKEGETSNIVPLSFYRPPSQKG